MMKIAAIMNDIYFFCYKNLLITDRSVVKTYKLLCHKFTSASKNWFQTRLLIFCAPLELTIRSKNQRVVNPYVVALGKIMLKLP